MRVLLDENLPHKLRHSCKGHEVSTVAYLDWAGVKNGALLTLAEMSGFEVFITADRNLEYQQNFQGREIAIVLLTAQTWTLIEPHMSQIGAAIDTATPRSFQLVECGRYRRD